MSRIETQVYAYLKRLRERFVRPPSDADDTADIAGGWISDAYDVLRQQAFPELARTLRCQKRIQEHCTHNQIRLRRRNQ